MDTVGWEAGRTYPDTCKRQCPLICQQRLDSAGTDQNAVPSPLVALRHLKLMLLYLAKAFPSKNLNLEVERQS